MGLQTQAAVISGRLLLFSFYDQTIKILCAIIMLPFLYSFCSFLLLLCPPFPPPPSSHIYVGNKNIWSFPHKGRKTKTNIEKSGDKRRRANNEARPPEGREFVSDAHRTLGAEHFFFLLQFCFVSNTSLILTRATIEVYLFLAKMGSE